MSKHKPPVTQAIRKLREAGIEFEGYPYTYVDGGGTTQFAAETGVDEHQVIKTLIMEDDHGTPSIVLMHGDREVSTQALARHQGVKRIQPCEPRTADRHSGYQVGGTSPFGTKRTMKVYCQSTIADLPRIYINGGKRGYILCLRTEDALRLLQPELVEMASPTSRGQP